MIEGMMVDYYTPSRGLMGIIRPEGVLMLPKNGEAPMEGRKKAVTLGELGGTYSLSLLLGSGKNRN